MLINPMVFEEWKEINFYSIKPNMYKISNFGRVFSYAKKMDFYPRQLAMDIIPYLKNSSLNPFN